MDGDRFFQKGWWVSIKTLPVCGVLSITISAVGGGRLVSRLESVVHMGVFYGMYCRPNT